MPEFEYATPWQPLLLAASTIEEENEANRSILFDPAGVIWWLRRTAALTAEQVAKSIQIGVTRDLAYLSAETNSDYIAARTTAGAILALYSSASPDR